MERIFCDVVDDTYKHSVEPEDGHSANRYEKNNLEANAVEATAEIDKAKNRKKIDKIKEDDVKHESFFVDVPVEEDDAK